MLVCRMRLAAARLRRRRSCLFRTSTRADTSFCLLPSEASVDQSAGEFAGAKGTISDSQAEKQLDELANREQKLTQEIQRLQRTFENVLTREQIEQRVKMFQGHPIASTKRRIAKYTKPESFKEQRGLCELAFAGERPDGKRNGVYVFWKDGKPTFRICGQLFIDVTKSASD